MLALFSSMLGEQHSQLTASRERLINGLNKLHETNSAVDAMQQELTALQPTLQQKTASAEQLLAQVGEAACTSSQLMWSQNASLKAFTKQLYWNSGFLHGNLHLCVFWHSKQTLDLRMLPVLSNFPVHEWDFK